MVKLDIKSKNRIDNNKVKISDKLFLVARYVEEKYGIITPPNYWDDAFSKFKQDDKTYYRNWLWICYVEWESLIPPIEETEVVFGKELADRLNYLDKNDWKDCEDVEEFLDIDGKGGETLLEWAKKHLISLEVEH
ncbi:hypothetical protein [Sediminitomix flava]|uniref:Uncharacterized protein n=1 Tax=Sediminitomix flava TaxID=379075 RepID=A0A315Z4D0_SEDFL|nr:hypothetical protein [Sediminitomix flava]PWJ37868.1 hypothetical protein BC781_1083 [Sediminitomix flava]